MKKNFRKIPTRIIQKLMVDIESQYVVVGALLVVKKLSIQLGEYSHLNLKITEKGLEIPEQILPYWSQGKYSDRNSMEYSMKRKDLPLQTRYRTREVPNFGDYSKGTHFVEIPYKAYPVDNYEPKNITILMECRDCSASLEEYAIKFEVNEVLDRNDDNFNEKLLTCLNLLQENIYNSDVMPAKSTFSEYLQTVQLAWEILPLGEKEEEEVIIRILSGKNKNMEQIQTIKERYRFFRSLNPKHIIVGTSGMARYFGARINDNLIVFENVRYGNAVYIMYEDWKVLSQKSRNDLIKGLYAGKFDRVKHSKGWEEKVKRIVDERRGAEDDIVDKAA